jgi:hypothetical protein
MSQSIDNNYIIRYENIYSYKNYSKILFILFILLFFIYLLIVINKLN